MDLEAMARELGLDRHEFLELLGLFLKASRDDLRHLETALDLGQPKTAAAYAHSLKGAALNLGLTEIAAQARNLEQAAQNAALERVAEHLASLRTQLQDLGHLAEISLAI